MADKRGLSEYCAEFARVYRRARKRGLRPFVRHATGVVLSGVADVFEEDSCKFGQPCSMSVGLGCMSVVGCGGG